MKIPYLLAFSDIHSLNKKILADMCDDLGISNEGNNEELASSIWEAYRESNENIEKLVKYSNLLLSTRGSVTWFKTSNNTHLLGLKDLLKNEGYNPFEVRKEYSNFELDSTPKLFAGHEINEHKYILRYVFRSGTTPVYSMNGKEDLPKSTFATVFVDEEKDILEVRAGQSVTLKVAQRVIKLLLDNGNDVEIAKKDILDHYESIGEFANSLGGKFKEAIDVPEHGTDEMTEVQIAAIASVLKNIDKALYDNDEGELSTSLENAKDNLREDYPNFSFLGLILTGLGKINLGSNIKDLRESPLYDCLSPHLSTKGGYIDYTVPVNGVETEGSIQVGLTTKTINFSKNSTEEMISFVRNTVYNV